MRPAKCTTGSTSRVEPGDAPGGYLAATPNRQAQPDRDIEMPLSVAGRKIFRVREASRRLSERLGYWQPSETDLIRLYAGRRYADDSRAEHDRWFGARVRPTPNLGGSLTGNAAALCCP
jgi:hypothetical protein